MTPFQDYKPQKQLNKELNWDRIILVLAIVAWLYIIFFNN